MKIEYITKYDNGQKVYQLCGLVIKTYTIIMTLIEIISVKGEPGALVTYRIREDSDDDTISQRNVSEGGLDTEYFTSKQVILDRIQSQL